MDEKPNYYSIIPAEVRYNTNLNSSQKLFYGEITALTYKTGECWASNTYFSKLYGVSPSLITNWVKALEKENLIAVDYEKKGQEITKRIIRILGIQNIEQVFNKSQEGYSKYLKENNTSINNTSKKEIYKERFVKPTIDEIKEYCKERNNEIDAERFFDYYETNGWVQGKNRKPIKNWKACIRTWESKDVKKLPEWFGKEITNNELTEEEQKEMDDLLNI